jgi:hypothetical protein
MAQDTISILDGSTVLLGLEPDGEHLSMDPHLPEKIERIELTGIPGRWGRVDPSSAVKEAMV